MSWTILKIYWFVAQKILKLFFFSPLFLFENLINSAELDIFDSHLVLLAKSFFCCSIWLAFYSLDPDPWIRIFLQIWIQEAKILRIRILSTALVRGMNF